MKVTNVTKVTQVTKVTINHEVLNVTFVTSRNLRNLKLI
jgi:hypothetical protein